MNLLELLQKEPKARERKNKSITLAYLLKQRYPVELPNDTVVDMVKYILKTDRAFRKTLEDNVDLRGSDYKDKDVLEEEAQLELGYHPMNRQDIKKLKTLN